MGIANMTNKLDLLLQKPYVHHQLSVAELVEKVLQRNEGRLTHTGAVAVTTGKYTGRSPKDKYIVEEPSTKQTIDWGTVNQPMSPETFEKLYDKVLDYLMKQL
ncbi:Phosphoenolpyruvate carboxykinase (ATP) [Geobacillus stearothermophilus]|uniref:Phosphoenolpyruvate carboxykinase (ATP) n=1 Tax=Geobacillus stearothermophilus TaxID=1422 RepID=A0ABQ7HEE0_GEOSE|nr:Phosphoenolpyruvate carboxykinase (ATP) [Geobacillus stearothermophilus]